MSRCVYIISVLLLAEVGDNAGANSRSSCSEKKVAKFQEQLFSLAKPFRQFNSTATTAKKIMAWLQQWHRTQMQELTESWSWVPQWLNSVRQWSEAAVESLHKQCGPFRHNMTATRAAFLLCFFLQSAFVSGQKVEPPEPEFLQPLENRTVSQGRDVYFTCVVNHLSNYKVAWIKSDSKAILAIHTHMIAQNARISVTHNGHNTWKLHISNVQKNDSGTYMCQINTDPMRSQMGTLKVVIPPDIVDNESSDGSAAVEGGTVRLPCHATGVPTPEVHWKRKDGRMLVLRHEGGREKQVDTVKGEHLVLNNIHRSDMGAYFCIAQNGVPPTVSKQFNVVVHFHPLIQVSNQLVAAPVGSDVLVQCYVEASPRAMNHWVRTNGEKLIPSEKYIMDEVVLNDYSLLMNLTIRNLEQRDFGGYQCKSSNALGRAEGTVRLQELHLDVKTTPATTTSRYTETRPRKPLVKDKPKKISPPRKKEQQPEERRHGQQREQTTQQSLPELKSRSPTEQTAHVATNTPRVVILNSRATAISGRVIVCFTFALLTML